MSLKETAEVAARLGRLGLRGEDAAALIRISRSLSRIGERQCNEDTTCPRCHGEGSPMRPGGENGRAPCKACAGTGDKLGKREASLIRKAESIAAIWGLKVYHQGDPRGAALYLYDPAKLAERDTQGAGISCWYSSVGTAIY